ncbi:MULTISPECIES: ABC transporter ATP-binding protein [unclassified Sedimentibacter]|uniref:ABC transporter ATP-binding protein n=1 Tax=unclassified Sedimentibacter TaxID=2649220 RepID=UPI0027DF0C60|nr:ABC transporter ATP-binding protein [Sedimentibacter sp. MB35-C1]WMJ77202.1 ABC transporter ATP-binding protein [Sedimentibacter sp. MB35-C1]
MNILNNLKNNFFYMKYIYEFSKSYIIAQSIISLLNGLLPLASIVIPKLIIDELLIKGNFRLIFQYIMFYFIILMTTSFVISVLQEKYINVNNYLYSLHFLMLINKKVATLDMAQLDLPETHQKIALANDIINKGIGTNAVNSFFNSLTSIVLIISTSIIISGANIWLSFIIIVFALLSVFLNLKTENWYISQREDTMYLIRLLNYYIRLIGDKNCAKEIRLYNFSNFIIEKHGKLFNKLKERLSRVHSWSLRIKIISILLENIKSNGILLYLAFLTFKGQISIGGFTQYFAATNQLSGSILTFVSFFTQLNINGKYIASFKEFMELEGKIEKLDFKKEKKSSDQDSPKLEAFNKIRLENINFGYEGSNCKILEDINCTFESGKLYVIVGENGSGKTTLINLISRLYEPTEGIIYLNDKPINEINCIEYRKKFSMVVQDFNHYAFTIAENIILDEYDEKDKFINDKINSCLIRVGLYKKVKALPNGLKSNLEKIFYDDGIILSGGENQKLALARALYKDTDILIMDEPSAALDPIAEDELLRNLKKIFPNKIIIFISHRLTCASYADQIVYLKNNKVHATGLHKDLMYKNSDYAKFYEAQANYYK